MASATGDASASRWRSQKDSRARSMAARSGPKSTATSSATSAIEVLERERAVCLLRQPLHARVGFGERAGGVAKMAHSLLEQRERVTEVEALLVEAADDLLEAREGLLQRHRGVSGSGRTARVVASTSPSRRRSVNACPSANCLDDVSVAPRSSRATE